MIADIESGGGSAHYVPVDVRVPELNFGAVEQAAEWMGGIDTVVAYALAQVGKDYAFFTKGPDSFDCSGLTLAAYRQGLLTQRGYVQVMRSAKKRLAAADIEDLSLRGNHLLLSIDRQQKLAVDEKDLPLIRI